MTQEQLNELAPNGEPTESFWALWKTNRDELRMDGVKVVKNLHEKSAGFILVVQRHNLESISRLVTAPEHKVEINHGLKAKLTVEDLRRPTNDPEGLAIVYDTEEAAQEKITFMGDKWSKYIVRVVPLVEYLPSTWTVNLGKPMSAKSLKWAKIKGRNSDRSAMAEEMEVYYAEGGKPSRAPLFHYVEEK